MQKYLKQFHYGDRDISSGVDTFWLVGSMKISALEQIGFLKKFYCEKLGVSTATTAAVKDILIREKNEQYTLSAKTGAGTLGKKALGWYVGYLEGGADVWFFALNIEGNSFDEILKPRSEITKAVLRELGHLPEGKTQD